MRRILSLLIILALPAGFLLAQTKATKTVKRAQPPTFTKNDPFFADAFKEGLVGERPADLGKVGGDGAVGNALRGVPNSANSAPDVGNGAGTGSGWSRLISAATIEDTIKSLKQQVDKEVTTLSDFKGNGHKLARRDYTLLAMLFGIASEYDGDVRWKKDAPAARDAFGRSAANFKVATDQAYNEAKTRKEELAELVGGSSPFAGKSAESKATWGQVASRDALMKYFETMWEPRLKPALADKAQFTANTDKILRDAELIAATGEVLSKEGMKDAGDSDYKVLCGKLRDAAKQIIDAVKAKDFDQASKASAAVGKACAECHESYK